MSQDRVSVQPYALHQGFPVFAVGKNNNPQALQNHKTVLLTGQNYYLGVIHGYFSTIQWWNIISCES